MELSGVSTGQVLTTRAMPPKTNDTPPTSRGLFQYPMINGVLLGVAARVSTQYAMGDKSSAYSQKALIRDAAIEGAYNLLSDKIFRISPSNQIPTPAGDIRYHIKNIIGKGGFGILYDMYMNKSKFSTKMLTDHAIQETIIEGVRTGLAMLFDKYVNPSTPLVSN